MSITRRDFLKSGLGLAGAAAIAGSPLLPLTAQAGKALLKPSIMVATGDSPADNVRKVLEALGGIEKFVKPGQSVFMKPNCITEMGPEFAVNTNPDVVAEVARLCKKAGAGNVFALAHDQAGVWEPNGIGNAIESNGGTIGVSTAIADYIEVKLPLGLILRDTMMIREFMEADVFINLPIAKHHGGAQLTLGMKNYMGLNWDRIIMHNTDLDQTIADLYTVRRPDLTVMDATRMLLNNGPSGPGSVRLEMTIAASTDGVALDAFTATLFKHEPHEIGHIKAAGEMGLGVIDLKKMDIKKLKV
ncbi:DUF362 domain-containing protein [bacterium]|nr:DUF362 domain-containing protein [bacterium]MBU1652629.1 DUF362 domain-containing protein [bacterium]